MPLSRLIFLIVTVLALAGGTVALGTMFLGTDGEASLSQIILFSVAVMALALGVRLLARRHMSRDDD